MALIIVNHYKLGLIILLSYVSSIGQHAYNHNWYSDDRTEHCRNIHLLSDNIIIILIRRLHVRNRAIGFSCVGLYHNWCSYLGVLSSAIITVIHVMISCVHNQVLARIVNLTEGAQ